MVTLSPQEKMSEFFCLDSFAGKSTSWLVPGVMSLILAFTDSLQYAMIAIVFFNLVGIIGMFFVKE